MGAMALLAAASELSGTKRARGSRAEIEPWEGRYDLPFRASITGKFECNSELSDEQELSYPWTPGESLPTESDLEDYAKKHFEDSENVELNAEYCKRNGEITTDYVSVTPRFQVRTRLGGVSVFDEDGDD